MKISVSFNGYELSVLRHHFGDLKSYQNRNIKCNGFYLKSTSNNMTLYIKHGLFDYIVKLISKILEISKILGEDFSELDKFADPELTPAKAKAEMFKLVGAYENTTDENTRARIFRQMIRIYRNMDSYQKEQIPFFEESSNGKYTIHYKNKGE